jgi:hypothetical protein
MPLIKKGTPNLTLQTGSEVSEDENGLLTGTCVYEGDIAYSGAVPRIGQLHPYDLRLSVYKRQTARLGLNKIRATLNYIGVARDPTPMFIEHPGGSGQDPIQTHPKFTDFAGTPASPKNGALFDAENGDFVGFTNSNSKFFGTTSYIVPSVMVNLTFYTHYVPDLGYVGEPYDWSVPNLIRPPNVRDFLLLGMPYRQIGNLFQVTHQILGSGPDGWNRSIYK